MGEWIEGKKNGISIWQKGREEELSLGGGRGTHSQTERQTITRARVCRNERDLTLQTVGVEQILALFVALHATLGAAHALPCNTPQQPLAFVAVGGGGGGPHFKVVWGGGGNGVNQSLQRLFVNVAFLPSAMVKNKNDSFLKVNTLRKELQHEKM